MTTTAAPTAVPMHPEAVVGHPELMVWVLPEGTLPAVGRLRHAPGDLGDLMADGLIATVTLVQGGGRILIGLGDGASWRMLGARVRTALHAALQALDAWVIDAEDDSDTNELIREGVEAVLAGPCGAYVASHGGRIELVEVRGGVAGIRFHGTCRTCPAAAITMSMRFERDLRTHCPVVRGVRRC